MALRDFVRDAREAIDGYQELSMPLTELEDGRFYADLSADANASEHLDRFAHLRLGGEIEAAVLCLDAPQPVLDLGDWESAEAAAAPDSGAWVGLAIAAGVEAGLEAEEVVNAGFSLTGGVEAGGRVELAHHLRVPRVTTGREALGQLLGELRIPYNPNHLRELGEGEVLQVELEGRAVLHATAGWSYGFVELFEGESLENLGLANLAGFEAEVAAGLSFKAGLAGDLRLLVTASSRHAGWVRVRLHKTHGHFVGAELRLEAGLRATQLDDFVDSLLDRLLSIPDGWVDELRAIEQRYDELRASLADVEGTLQSELSELLSKAWEEVDLGDFESFLERSGRRSADPVAGLGAHTLAPDTRSFLEDLRARIERLRDRLERGLDDFQNLVDETLDPITAPLDAVAARVGEWLAAYDDLRAAAARQLTGLAERELRAEISSAINRASSGEALLDLEFDLDVAEDLCLAALRGNFAPALERAVAPGAGGVELHSGVLKDTVRAERHRHLKLHLFGFDLRADFRNWSEVTLSEDLVARALRVVGRAGARLTFESSERRRELAFLFELYGAAERRGAEVFLAPGAGFEATLERRATLEREREIAALLPIHLAGAEKLALVGREEAARLLELLGGGEGRYRYDLTISFPTSALERVFRLGPTAPPGRVLELQVWEELRRALGVLDVEILADEEVGLLSHFVNRTTIDDVRREPRIDAWTLLRPIRIDGRAFPEGALRAVWAYLLDTHTFVRAYLRARAALLANKPVDEVVAELRRMSGEVSDAVGTFGTRPLDAKYLALAFLEGGLESKVHLTLERGDLKIHL